MRLSTKFTRTVNFSLALHLRLLFIYLCVIFKLLYLRLYLYCLKKHIIYIYIVFYTYTIWSRVVVIYQLVRLCNYNVVFSEEYGKTIAKMLLGEVIIIFLARAYIFINIFIA